MAFYNTFQNPKHGKNQEQNFNLNVIIMYQVVSANFLICESFKRCGEFWNSRCSTKPPNTAVVLSDVLYILTGGTELKKLAGLEFP